LADVFAVARSGVNEKGAIVHRRAMAFGEIIIDGDDVAGVQELLDAHRPNITGAAGDKYIHQWTVIEGPAMLNGKQGSKSWRRGKGTRRAFFQFS
jgi:hypothetical protein